MIVYVLGNGKSLNKVKLSSLKHKITIGCNHIYRSGFIPTYWCIQDTNFFNYFHHKVTDFNTTFVISNIIKKSFPIFEKTRHIIVDYPATSGVITTLSFPLAKHLLEGEKEKEIRCLGIDQDQEKIHFYKETRMESKDICDILGLDYQIINFESHTEENKEIIKKEFEILRDDLYQNNIKVFNCSGELSKMECFPRKVLGKKYLQ